MPAQDHPGHLAADAPQNVLGRSRGGSTLLAAPSCHRPVKTELSLNELVLPFTVGANSHCFGAMALQSTCFPCEPI